MIDVEKLNQLLYKPDEAYQVNKKLVKLIGADEALLYTYLLTVYFNECHTNFDNLSYFSCSVERIEDALGFSAFKQRNLLGSLVKHKLIFVKFGQKRARYISINENLNILEKLLYADRYKRYENLLITQFIKNLEELKKNENLSYEDSMQLYNFITQSNFNKSLKQSDEFKNISIHVFPAEKTHISEDLLNV